eukprot:9635-Heterococcus_DN1.PRE.3
MLLVKGVVWSALAAVVVTAQCVGRKATYECCSREAHRLNAKFEKHLFEAGMWAGGELEMQEKHRCTTDTALSAEVWYFAKCFPFHTSESSSSFNYLQ